MRLEGNENFSPSTRQKLNKIFKSSEFMNPIKPDEHITHGKFSSNQRAKKLCSSKLNVKILQSNGDDKKATVLSPLTKNTN